MWRIKEIMSQALEIWEKPTSLPSCTLSILAWNRTEEQKDIFVFILPINRSYHHYKSSISLSIYKYKGTLFSLLCSFLHVLQLILFFFACEHSFSPVCPKVNCLLLQEPHTLPIFTVLHFCIYKQQSTSENYKYESTTLLKTL